MNQLERRRQEQRLLAKEHSAQPRGISTTVLSQLLLAPFIERAMRQRSYGEVDLSPLLRKAG